MGIERKDSAFQAVFQKDTWDKCPEYTREQIQCWFVFIERERERIEQIKSGELLGLLFCLVQDNLLYLSLVFLVSLGK